MTYPNAFMASIRLLTDRWYGLIIAIENLFYKWGE